MENLYKNLLKASKVGNLGDIKKYTKDENINYENIVDKHGNNMLNIASFEGYYDVVKYLIEKLDFNTEHENNYGYTPLHNAVIGGKLEIIKLLVEKYNVNVNEKDNNGDVPLIKAVRWDKYEIVKYLIEHGADKTSKDYKGRDALFFSSSCKNKNIKELLKK